MYMVLFAAYAVLLSKYTGEEDLVIGTPIAGRDHAAVNRIVGMFVNTLPLRIAPKKEYAVQQWLLILREQMLRAFEYGHYPLDELIEQLNIARDPSRNPLFDTMFVLQDAKRDAVHLPGLTIEPMEWQSRNAKFDMTWVADESEDGLRLTVEYDTDLYTGAQMERMLIHFEHILAQMSGQPSQLLKEIELITEAEKQAVLERFNATDADYPKHTLIHEQFEQQAALRPDHPALMVGGKAIRYGVLNQLADRFAVRLREAGVIDGQPVGLLANRSAEMIVAIFAILKAGGAYVPLDPTHPHERLAYILKDCQAKLLILTPEQTKVPEFAGEVMTISLAESEAVHAEVNKVEPDVEAESDVEANLDVEADPYVEGDLRAKTEIADSTRTAYVMYTSGSTGAPKGVVTTHRNVVKTVINNGFIQITEQDRMLQLSNYAFDGSTYEIFGALLNGATLVIIPHDDVLDMARLAHTFDSMRITSAFMTSVLFNALVDYDLTSLRHVRRLFVGGEALSKPHVLKALDALGEHRIANGYGPTETTVFATTYPIGEEVRSLASIPIGKPIHNTKAYVLDQNGHLLPVGVPGELCIGGDGVAKHYVGLPELTADKFVDDPFNPGGRMYRTGDLVSWFEDGRLEFHGRIDDQIKIRGNGSNRARSKRDCSSIRTC